MQYSLEASISGPPSWYGQRGFPRLEHAGVTFKFFANKTGEGLHDSTVVSKGQFPEFVFAVK